MFLSNSIWAADAGDLVSAAFFTSFGHPPGFPLYLLLLKLFLMFPFGTLALRASLLSLVFWTFGIFFSSLSSYVILRNAKISIASTLIVFGSSLMFLYGIVQEVFSMTIFFISLLLFLLIKLHYTKRDLYHALFLIILCIALFHHYIVLFVMIFPYALYVLFNTDSVRIFYKQKYMYILFAIILGIIPYVIYFYIQKESPIHWEDNTIYGLFRMITRARYGFSNTTGRPFMIDEKLFNVYLYLKSTSLNLYLLVLLIIPGGLFLYKKSKSLFYILFSGLFVSSLTLIAYVNLPSGSFHDKGILERYFLFSYPFLTVFIALGCAYMFNLIVKIRFLYIAGIVIWCGISCLIVFNSIMYYRYHLKIPYFELHAKNMLDEIPERGVLRTSGDINIFPIQYMMYIKNYRNDVKLVYSNERSLKIAPNSRNNKWNIFLTIPTNAPFFQQELRELYKEKLRFLK